MRILLGIFSFMLLLVTGAVGASGLSCHLDQSEPGGAISKVCNGAATEIPFNYGMVVVNLGDDDSSKSMAVLSQTPKDSEMRDESYFVFDYDNMVVYDQKCLGGNFVMFDEARKGIVFSKWGEEELNLFVPKKFDHCKLPLDELVDRNTPS